MEGGRQLNGPHRWWPARSRGVPGRAALGLALVLAVGAHSAAVAAQGSGGRLYRYTNEQGRVEIGNAIPAERVRGGYQVLDAATGQVIETVAPELSPAELAAKAAREQAEAACRNELERVRALYGSVADIDSAEEQAHRALESRVGHLDAARELEQRRLEEQEREAAQRERTGREVTAEMQADMARSREQIATITAEIEQRRGEQEKSKEGFARDRELFQKDTCDPAPPR
jgi:hypothetical protein